MINLKLIVALTAASIALNGCADYQYKTSDGQCLTCMNNPFTGEAMNYDPQSTPQKSGNSATSQSGSVTVNSPLDVDTAYARIKNEFGFTTPEEEGKRIGGVAGKFAAGDSSTGYENSTPGANYELKSQVFVNHGGRYELTQRAHIQKNGSGSTVVYSWAPSENPSERGQAHYDGNAVKNILEKKVKSALQ
ncbi:hypothetical protein [Carnimonas bestiolae]|uniref:hypothetical protein n=1 Tax=Carnimonas bestiolae TaxID=3402172 RepID=UPI003EDC1321